MASLQLNLSPLYITVSRNVVSIALSLTMSMAFLIWIQYNVF